MAQQPTPQQIEQTVRMARAYAAEQLPWFAPALFAARVVLADNCPSLAAIDNGMRAYFSPAMVGELLADVEPQRGIVEIAWVWVHEISHVLRDHSDRARERNAEPFRWNLAADLEINDAAWEGLWPPHRFPPLLAPQFGLPPGKLAEFYYQHLPTLPVQSVCDAGAAWADEGSGIHGQVRAWEIGAGPESQAAVSTLEQQAIRQSIAAAMHAIKDRGTIPAGWRRWAEESLQPRVNWRERLRRRVRGAVVAGVGNRLDYGFQRPHRRGAVYAPFIRPVLQGDFLPRIACVVDTSGSISEKELCRSLAEVRGVLESMRTPITVIPCDAVAYDPVRVLTQSDFLSLKDRMIGGGGTDMVAGIESALGLRPPPDVVIVLTDGYTPYPSRPYRTPVLFGLLNPTNRANVPQPSMPPWKHADVIVIDA